MERTRLSSKGQVIIPRAVRVAHGWAPGVEFSVEDVGDGVLLRPLKPFPETRVEDVMGCIPYQGPRRSLEDMEAAIKEGGRRRR